jgi:hypothetical protein
VDKAQFEQRTVATAAYQVELLAFTGSYVLNFLFLIYLFIYLFTYLSIISLIIYLVAN